MHRLARQRDRHLSAILNGLRAAYCRMWACLKEEKPSTRTHIRTQSSWRLKAIWLRLQQLALGLNEETPVCQSGAMATLPVLWSRPAWSSFLREEPTEQGGRRDPISGKNPKQDRSTAHCFSILEKWVIRRGALVWRSVHTIVLNMC